MFIPFLMGGLCACLGISAAWRLRARTACLRAWQRSFAAMHAACAYRRATCAQVLRAGAADRPLLSAAARAVEISGADAGRLFRQEEQERLLRPEEKTVIVNALRAVSSGSREEMGEALAYAAERFSHFCEQSEKKRDANARMYLTLGVLSGVCVFLILW
ncbi:MAG: stage III sporulation protein AB [Clostridia bacterium]|nr:stage III sporulation protein AB [Clostridia bacterium]